MIDPTMVTKVDAIVKVTKVDAMVNVTKVIFIIIDVTIVDLTMVEVTMVGYRVVTAWLWDGYGLVTG